MGGKLGEGGKNICMHEGLRQLQTLPLRDIAGLDTVYVQQHG